MKELPKKLKSPLRIVISLDKYQTDIRVIRVKPSGWIGGLNQEILGIKNAPKDREELLKIKGFKHWLGLAYSGDYEKARIKFIDFLKRNPASKVLLAEYEKPLSVQKKESFLKKCIK